MPPVPESPFKPRSPFSPFSPFRLVPVEKEMDQLWLGMATPPCPPLCALGKGKAAGITSRGDPQRLLHPGPLSLLWGPPATPRATAPCHRGGGHGNSIHQPWDSLHQQQGDTVALLTPQCRPVGDSCWDTIKHPMTSAMHGTQPSLSLEFWGLALSATPAGSNSPRPCQRAAVHLPSHCQNPQRPVFAREKGVRAELGAWWGAPLSPPGRADSAHLCIILLVLALVLGCPRVPSELQICNHPLQGDHRQMGDTDKPPCCDVTCCDVICCATRPPCPSGGEKKDG